MIILLQISNKTEVGRGPLHPELNRSAGYDWKHIRFDQNIIYRPNRCVDCAAHIECILCICVCSMSSAPQPDPHIHRRGSLLTASVGQAKGTTALKPVR